MVKPMITVPRSSLVALTRETTSSGERVSLAIANVERKYRWMEGGDTQS